MDVILYMFQLGFSGADLGRALWIGLIISLFVNPKFLPWPASLMALGIDRLWPFYTMFTSGYEPPTIALAFWGTLLSIPSDIAFYIIRFLGLFAIVAIGYNLRCKIHNVDPLHRKTKPSGPKGYLPY